MLRFSLSTVARRIREHGLVNLSPYSTISDEDLDGVVRDVQALFPNIGYRRMLSELTRRGIVIQHARVRVAPCKGIRIPESRNFLLVES